jgi:NAD-dependent DNA ligase
MAELITDEYDLYALMEEVTETDLAKISGIGPSRAKDVVEGLEQRRPLIEKLMGCGIKIKKPVAVTLQSTKLQGKSFQVTGPLTKINPATQKAYKREEWYELVQANGGEIKRVGKELNYLLACRPNSNKLSKASAMGISVIPEADFWKMME